MEAKHGIAIELGTGGKGDPTLLGYNFIANTVEEFMQSALDKFLDKDNKKIVSNVKFAARGKNRMTNFISSQCKTPCLQLEVGDEYRNIKKPERLEALVVGLQCAIESIYDEL